MSAPTPEDVAREIVDRACAYVPELAAVLRERDRAARAAAIEEAARVADADAVAMAKALDRALHFNRERIAEHRESDIATAKRIAAAIRALGEESARGEPHGGCPK